MLDSKPSKPLPLKAILWLFIIILFLNAVMLVIIRARYQESYYAALVDKIGLLEDTHSPRIIFVGGSNVAFGIDSEKISQQTGYNVVNMGLNGNLGIRFMLATIKPTLQLGDIVIIMPEYQQFLNEKNNMGPAYLQTLIANPTLLRYISSADEVIYLAEIFPYVYTQTVRSFCKDLSQRDCLFCENNEQIYHRSAFNTFGDMMSHEQIHPTQEISHLYLENRQNNPNISKTISIINKFALYVEEKMGSVFLLYPATPSPSDDATYEILDYLDLRLKNELNITVVGNPSDAWYSRGFFFDTYYHLTPQGREINTERVIDYLLSILQK